MDNAALSENLEKLMSETLSTQGISKSSDELRHLDASRSLHFETANNRPEIQKGKAFQEMGEPDHSSVNQQALSPIVMLRGLGRCKHHWASFKDELQKAFPNRQIVMVDLPGNGELNHLQSPTTIKEAASAISTQLELQGIQKPCDFIGLSLGGMITLYLLENSDWVRKACVINTSLAALSFPNERIKPRALFHLLYSRALPVGMQEKLIWRYTANQPVDKAIVKNWVNVANIYRVSTKNLWRQIQIARSYDKKPILGKKSKDLLILSAKRDELVSAKCSKKLAKFTKAEHKVHKSAGHDLPLDDPQWVASCTYQFFK